MTTLLPAGLLDNFDSSLVNSDDLSWCSMMVDEFSMDCGLAA
jgi:hypothetical protein